MQAAVHREKLFCQSYSLVLGLLGVGMIPGRVKRLESDFSLSHTQMGALLAVAAVFLFLSARELAQATKAPRVSLLALARSADRARILPGVAAFVFLSGCELTVITWLATYLESEQGLPPENALLCLGVMMMGCTLVRFLLALSALKAGSAFMVLALAGNVAAAMLFEKLSGGRGLLAGLFNVGSTIGSFVFLALVVSPINAAAFAALYWFFLGEGKWEGQSQGASR